MTAVNHKDINFKDSKKQETIETKSNKTDKLNGLCINTALKIKTTTKNVISYNTDLKDQNLTNWKN